MDPQFQENRIGIICGGGSLPSELAHAAIASGCGVHLIGIAGEADKRIENYPHSWIKWGEFGRMFHVLEQENCKDIVIIGTVTRPDLSQVRLDFGAVKMLPFIVSLLSGGDNSVLSNIVKFFESKGFQVRGAHEIAPNLLSPSGVVSRLSPEAADHDDIEIGLNVILAMAPFDVGQAVVVARGHVLGVEAAEGTDDMLRRCRDLRQWGAKTRTQRSGVLIKCPKPGQDLRIDLPTIGPRTLEFAAEAGLNGIAVRAGHVLLADRTDLQLTADRHKLFVIGVDHDS